MDPMTDPSLTSEAPVGQHKRARVAGWILGLMGAVMTLFAWSVASPAGSAPDDNFHFATIWCKSVWNEGRCQFESVAEGAYGQAYYLIPPQAGFTGYAQGSLGTPCFAFKPGQEAICPDTPVIGRTSINDGLYPPVFYAFAGLFTSEDPGRTAVQVRLAVGAAAIALLAGAYAVSLRWLRPALILSIAVGLVPLGLSFIASTNPSSWAIAGVMGVWPAATTLMLSRRPRQQVAAGVVLALSIIMACGARADAAAYVAATLFLLGATLWRRSVWPARLTVAVSCAVAVAIFMTSGQTSNVTRGFQEGLGGRGLGEVAWSLVKALPGLWIGGTGAPGGVTNGDAEQLGWFDVAIPPTAWAALLMVIGALILLGLAWMPWQKTVTVVGLLGLAFVVPGYALILNRALPGELVQPRYLLPLMLVIFGLVMVRSGHRPLGLNLAQAGCVFVAVSLAQALSLHVFLRRFITGVDVLGPDLTAGAQWWWPDAPLSPNQVLFIGVLGWTLVCLVAVSHVWQRRVATDERLLPGGGD